MDIYEHWTELPDLQKEREKKKKTMEGKRCSWGERERKRLSLVLVPESCRERESGGELQIRAREPTNGGRYFCLANGEERRHDFLVCLNFSIVEGMTYQFQEVNVERERGTASFSCRVQLPNPTSILGPTGVVDLYCTPHWVNPVVHLSNGRFRFSSKQ